jgi:hypothetical protein
VRANNVIVGSSLGFTCGRAAARRFKYPLAAVEVRKRG